jgi:hypothetical protein
MRLRVLVAVWLAVAARGADVSDLLERLEQTSRTQAPLAHIDTLLSAAEVLPLEEPRLRLLGSAVSLLGSIREEEPRYFYLAAAAHLLARQDRDEAEQICLRIPARQSARWRADYRGRCWQFLVAQAKQRRATVMKGLQTGAFQIPEALVLIEAEPENGADILQLLMTSFPRRNAAPEDVALLDKAARLMAPFNLGLAREAALLLRQAPAAPEPEIEPEDAPAVDRAEEFFRVADDLGLPPGERSTRLLKVLDATAGMKNYARRLQLQTYLTAWFTAEGATGTATKAMELLDASLGLCKDETCLESIDELVEFIVKNRIDPENLRVRHASLAARLLLRELRIVLEEEAAK